MPTIAPALVFIPESHIVQIGISLPEQIHALVGRSVGEDDQRPLLMRRIERLTQGLKVMSVHLNGRRTERGKLSFSGSRAMTSEVRPSTCWPLTSTTILTLPSWWNAIDMIASQVWPS